VVFFGEKGAEQQGQGKKITNKAKRKKNAGRGTTHVTSHTGIVAINPRIRKQRERMKWEKTLREAKIT